MGNRRKQIYGTCTLCIKYYKVTNLETSVPKRSASTTHKAETLHALLLPNDNFVLVKQVARKINRCKRSGVLLKLDLARAFDSIS
jgi:hypothetical protein